MTGEISLEWIKHFDAHTSEKAAGATCLLLVDGHTSHYSLEVLDYARAHNIVMLCYPSHSTHVLQGLDAVGFSRLKELYFKYAAEHEDTTGQSISKSTFLEPFSRAYVETFTKDTIKAAFRSTGAYPIDPGALTRNVVAPSLPTSIRSTLPIKLPEPVLAAAGMWDLMHTESETEAGPSSNTVDKTINTSRTSGPLRDLLAHTSASFLTSNLPIKSENTLEELPFQQLPPLPPSPPHADCLMTSREQQLEAQIEAYRSRESVLLRGYCGAYTQLVLVDRHCKLLQSQLGAKEAATEAKRAGKGKERLMGDSLPRILTQGEFYNQSVKQQSKREKLKTMKEEWERAAQAQKTTYEDDHRRWQEGPLAEWIRERDLARSEGRKRRWNRPKAPQKPKPIPKPWVQKKSGEEGAVGGATGDVEEEAEEENNSEASDT